MTELWVAISNAAEDLAERYFEHFDADWMGAYSSAWEALIRSLEQGETISRTADPKSFRWYLHTETGKTRQRLKLGEGSEIPSTFWHHCREARRQFLYQRPTAARQPTFGLSADYVEFTQPNGIVDGLAMFGEARRIEVKFTSLPQGNREANKRQRGAPKGHRIDDSAFVERAAGMIDAGYSFADAVAGVAPHMGTNATLPSLKTRLRRRLKDLGYT